MFLFALVVLAIAGPLPGEPQDDLEVIMKESDPTLLRPDIVQSGSQAQPNDEAPLQVMEMISLVDPDGVVHNLEFIADENGLRPNNIKG